MEVFTPDIKIADLILSNHQLIPVLNRFGIRLGVKEKTLRDICREKNIDAGFLVEIINTYCNEEYLPESGLQNFSPLLIVEYLNKAHLYYTHTIMPRMEVILEKLVLGSSNVRDIRLIQSFYFKYKEELLNHIEYEEKTVFPYIINLVKDNNRTNYSIKDFEKEHNDVEIKINDLKNLIIKYIEPDYEDNDCYEFLQLLFLFEKDIMDHSRIEEKILIPQLIKIEDSLDKNAK